jgi:hypothetical protein
MVWRAGREIGVEFTEPLQPAAMHADPAFRELAMLHAFGHVPGRPGTPGVEPDPALADAGPPL